EQPARALGAFVPVDVGLTTAPTTIDVAVELQPTVRVWRSILADRGRPLPGAFVRVEEEPRPLPLELETSADGRYSAPGRLRGRAYRISVRRAGYLPDGPRLVRAGTTPGDFRLRRGAALEGQVVD